MGEETDTGTDGRSSVVCVCMCVLVILTEMETIR